MTTETALNELSFTVSGRVSRPCAEVYEAVTDPEQLSRYFATGGAQGRLANGEQVEWKFNEVTSPFPVTVIADDPPHCLVIEWGAEAAGNESGKNRAVFEFEPLDGDTRTLITITETSWKLSRAGADDAFDHCEGWTFMLASLKAWLEHGITLRDGYYM